MNMNNVKIIYYNAEAIDQQRLETSIFSNANCVGHYIIKPGLLLVNFRGSARDLFNAVESITTDNSIFIHDLDSDSIAYWGIMNKTIWEWLQNNRR